MAGSWRRIHYGLRPAKSVERKLMAEGLSRLDRLEPLERFRYVGMGSLYFADFSLFHRRLGLAEMHSIEDEDDVALRERFEANRPFDTKLHFEHTNAALPRLFKPGESPAIAWLDYDNPLDSAMLSDAALIVSSATAPTVLAVTANVEPGAPGTRRDKLADAVGDDLVPAWVAKETHLSGDQTRMACYDILIGRVEAALRARNGSLADVADAVSFRQLFHFAYSDGARMFTVVGVLHSAAQTAALDACVFGTLPYHRSGADPFRIVVPMLTTRETLALDAQLPGAATPTLRGVSASDCEAYARLYRYLPSYVDAEL